ncbi:MAG: CGNR zinc finger domain-containing protein [Nocardioidaceae bacterium]|nr:CGNR zinc finger domain-containing protein [Nocardioidaceae bacterium]
MLFADDTQQSLQAAATVANTAQPPERLRTVAELDTLVTELGYSGRRDRDLAELEEVRRLRPLLRDLLLAERDAAVVLVNDVLARAGATPQLVRHDDSGWHVHAVPSDAPLATRMAVETAMAMIDVVRADELSRLSVCADADCEGVVVDLSRNRSRRFCSTTCTNRNAVAAYRARRARTTSTPAPDVDVRSRR